MNEKNLKSKIAIVLIMVLLSAVSYAEENSSKNIHLSIFGALGSSGAFGDYPSEYDAEAVFSFYPGLRLSINDTFMPNTYILIDFGYLETGFEGYVLATDTNFNNTYEYLNLNAMFGSQINQIYYAAGLYFGIGLDAYSYREYEDDWFDLDSNSDFGFVAEAGFQPVSFLSLGVQGRYGLKSIGSSVDIKNWAILGTIGIHFFQF
ncbi:MAG: hypothetical protein KAQ93_03310 [Spirochaetales bacterium]|nr:hypothetical protein [Spirochaetales bacterium]